MNIISNILLFAPPQGEQGGGLMSLLPLLLVIVVFYFFMIRPQMKKAKEERKYRESLKKGDKVITAGGIHGKIVQVNDDTFLIDTGNNNTLKVEKSSIMLHRENNTLNKNK